MAHSVEFSDDEHAHGRSADSPEQIPVSGWRQILGRVWQRGRRNGISVTAAGVAFYTLLTFFPGVLALIGLFGLFVGPDMVEGGLFELGNILPPQAAELVVSQMKELTERSLMGVGAIGGLLIGAWSASAGVRALMQACNVAYDEEESRPLLRTYRTSLVLTLFGLLLWAGVVVIALSVPFALRWVVLAAAMMLSLAVLYRYAPSRRQPRWEWVSWGAVAATLLWLGGTSLFTLYVSNLGRFNHLYGALGAVVIVLLWLLISGHAILLGAELNAEMQRQTRKNTSVG
ncbi:MAG TPA: YihY/virulence factor BrkB family protein [Burkholderiales bacterium]|nr:YihY/virulence factor BrkB family protein [Burkholderiales bacterium]